MPSRDSRWHNAQGVDSIVEELGTRGRGARGDSGDVDSRDGGGGEDEELGGVEGGSSRRGGDGHLAAGAG